MCYDMIIVDIILTSVVETVSIDITIGLVGVFVICTLMFFIGVVFGMKKQKKKC